jgi:hypothetical protein
MRSSVVSHSALGCKDTPTSRSTIGASLNIRWKREIAMAPLPSRGCVPGIGSQAHPKVALRNVDDRCGVATNQRGERPTTTQPVRKLASGRTPMSEGDTLIQKLAG